MEEDNYGSVQDVKIVDSPREVNILYDLTYLTVLQTIVRRGLPASVIAKEAEISLDRVLYRLRVLTETGLVRVVHEQPRHGRPIKYYRAVAKTFFTPAATTVELAMDGWRDHRQLRTLLDRIVTNLLLTTTVEHGGIDGELVSFDPRGTIERSVGYFADNAFTKLPPHVMEDKRLSYGEFVLSPSAAKTFVQDVGDAITKAMETSQESTERTKRLYSFVVAIGPVPRSN